MDIVQIPEGDLARAFFDRAEQIGAARAAREFRLPYDLYGADSDYFSTAVEIEPGYLTLFRCEWRDRWDTDTMSVAKAMELTANREYPISGW